jgi:hypothetical protein
LGVADNEASSSPDSRKFAKLGAPVTAFGEWRCNSVPD